MDITSCVVQVSVLTSEALKLLMCETKCVFARGFRG